ncbi:MAG: hypothetical protein EOP10_04215 [Proteobacteria bacterium]|nr:MAG: hypothetical protein EOP10_04215 [Pseudomonadota bacterium]
MNILRPKFLSLALLLGLGSSLSCTPHEDLSKVSAVNAPTRRVELNANSYVIDGRPMLLRGGSIQWFRIPKAEWEDRVIKFKAAGFNTIDMYTSWRDFEPHEGVFDFETKDFRAFLDLAKKHGLYVYFRPGPYITNEMDGGGVPAWVFAKSSKSQYSETEADGTLNLRTNDKDYLDAVDRYWSRLLPLVKPYLYSEGGPIILFGIENEYSWFKTFFEVDKLADYQGNAERSTEQKLNAAAHLAALRDIALKNGIDVPITTCQGNAAAVEKDLVAGVYPMPNYYITDAKLPEYTASRQLNKMHKTEEYRNSPSGTTETERNVATLRRQLLGGFDAVFHFNVVGMFGEGRQNTVTLFPPDTTKFSFDTVKGIYDALRAPKIGFFHNAVDYYGVIGPAGTVREKFFSFRRTNLFLTSFENLIAAAGEPKRTSSWNIPSNDKKIQVKDDRVGSLDPDANGRRVNYWLDLGDGAALLGLLNASGQTIELKRNSLVAFGEKLPRFTPITIPAETYPGSPASAGVEAEYDFLMPLRFPLGDSFTLDYSTSEVLQFKDDLLVIYGEAGSQGEARFRSKSIVTGEFSAVNLEELHERDLTVTYTHSAKPQTFEVTNIDGDSIRVLILDRETAGRAWFENNRILLGPDLVQADHLTLRPGHQRVWSSAPIESFAAFEKERMPGFIAYDLPATDVNFSASPVPFTQHESKAELDDDFAGYRDLNGAETAMEQAGIYEGQAWYRTQVELTDEQIKGNLDFYAESVGDFASLYINGNYVLTLTPLGTEIKSASKSDRYRFAIPKNFWKVGTNRIILRADIWGHGSFMFPRGTLTSIPAPVGGRWPVLGLKVRIPGLGYDAMKGLIGRVSLGSIKLDKWQISGGMSAERDTAPTATTPTAFPLTLEKGAVTVLRGTLNKDLWMDREQWSIPLALKLSGRNAKATIYLNGTIIGRWLSDEGWMQRGSWMTPIRTMWSSVDPNTFPLSYGSLKDGNNELKIIVEDCSEIGKSVGTVEAISVELQPEEKTATDGRQAIIPQIYKF